MLHRNLRLVEEPAELMTRIEVTPRGTAHCGFAYREGERCVLPINRILNGAIRICHIHALEVEQGSPVFLPNPEDRDRIMRELAA